MESSFVSTSVRKLIDLVILKRRMLRSRNSLLRVKRYTTSKFHDRARVLCSSWRRESENNRSD